MLPYPIFKRSGGRVSPAKVAGTLRRAVRHTGSEPARLSTHCTARCLSLRLCQSSRHAPSCRPPYRVRTCPSFHPRTARCLSLRPPVRVPSVFRPWLFTQMSFLCSFLDCVRLRREQRLPQSKEGMNRRKEMNRSEQRKQRRGCTQPLSCVSCFSWFRLACRAVVFICGRKPPWSRAPPCADVTALVAGMVEQSPMKHGYEPGRRSRSLTGNQ